MLEQVREKKGSSRRASRNSQQKSEIEFRRLLEKLPVVDQNFRSAFY